jgi:hypothetical protein
MTTRRTKPVRSPRGSPPVGEGPGGRTPAVCADGGPVCVGCLAGNNFKVVVRVRPPLPRELNGDKRFQNIARIENDCSITLSENLPALDDPRSDDATAVRARSAADGFCGRRRPATERRADRLRVCAHACRAISAPTRSPLITCIRSTQTSRMSTTTPHATR